MNKQFYAMSDSKFCIKNTKEILHCLLDIKKDHKECCNDHVKGMEKLHEILNDIITREGCYIINFETLNFIRELLNCYDKSGISIKYHLLDNISFDEETIYGLYNNVLSVTRDETKRVDVEYNILSGLINHFESLKIDNDEYKRVTAIYNKSAAKYVQLNEDEKKEINEILKKNDSALLL